MEWKLAVADPLFMEAANVFIQTCPSILNSRQISWDLNVFDRHLWCDLDATGNNSGYTAFILCIYFCWIAPWRQASPMPVAVTLPSPMIGLPTLLYTSVHMLSFPPAGDRLWAVQCQSLSVHTAFSGQLETNPASPQAWPILDSVDHGDESC